MGHDMVVSLFLPHPVWAAVSPAHHACFLPFLLTFPVRKNFFPSFVLVEEPSFGRAFAHLFEDLTSEL